MRVLITGANGFVGSKLVYELLNRNHEVFAGITSDHNYSAPIQTGYLNVLDKETINHIIKNFKPQGIIHLAAQSMVSKSWNDPRGTVEANVIGTINLFESIKQYSPKAKILTIGSSEEYGLSGKQGVSLTEEAPCFPQNPYAVSKYSAGQIALQLAIKESLNLLHIRPFNHFGPGQNRGFVISDFIEQIVKIENRRIEPIINVGDLSAQRDFIYIEDVIRAYIMLLEENVDCGIFNVCSGIPRRIEDILLYLLNNSKVSITVNVDESKIRISNVPLFIGSSQKIQQSIGWYPKKDFYEGLNDTLEWWREKTYREGEYL